jgi:hypothetical protein
MSSIERSSVPSFYGFASKTAAPLGDFFAIFSEQTKVGYFQEYLRRDRIGTQAASR